MPVWCAGVSIEPLFNLDSLADDCHPIVEYFNNGVWL